MELKPLTLFKIWGADEGILKYVQADYMAPTVAGVALFVREDEFRDKMILTVPGNYFVEEMPPVTENLTVGELVAAYRKGRLAVRQ